MAKPHVLCTAVTLALLLGLTLGWLVLVGVLHRPAHGAQLLGEAAMWDLIAAAAGLIATRLPAAVPTAAQRWLAAIMNPMALRVFKSADKIICALAWFAAAAKVSAFFAHLPVSDPEQTRIVVGLTAVVWATADHARILGVRMFSALHRSGPAS